MNSEAFSNLISWPKGFPSFSEEPRVIPFEINKNSTVFEGHFPEQPILPGVVMIALLKHAISEMLQQPISLQEAANFKFLKPINPLETKAAELHLTIKKTDSELKVKGSIQTVGETFFKASATYHIQ